MFYPDLGSPDTRDSVQMTSSGGSSEGVVERTGPGRVDSSKVRTKGGGPESLLSNSSSPTSSSFSGVPRMSYGYSRPRSTRSWSSSFTSWPNGGNSSRPRSFSSGSLRHSRSYSSSPFSNFSTPRDLRGGKGLGEGRAFLYRGVRPFVPLNPHFPVPSLRVPLREEGWVPSRETSPEVVFQDPTPERPRDPRGTVLRPRNRTYTQSPHLTLSSQPPTSGGPRHLGWVSDEGGWRTDQVMERNMDGRKGAVSVTGRALHDVTSTRVSIVGRSMETLDSPRKHRESYGSPLSKTGQRPVGINDDWICKVSMSNLDELKFLVEPKEHPYTDDVP